MSEKKYRITHNPYKRKTKVEEYYPGASNPWKILGSEKEPTLNYLLEQKESIQQIFAELLTWIENYNNKFSNSKPYEILFNGIRQDYFEIKTLSEVFMKKNKECKFSGMVQPEKFWDSSILIQKELEKISQGIIDIYLEENDVLTKLKDCFDSIDQNLNILVLGMQNSGKSTLINALLGKEILPTSEGIETAAMYTIEAGSEDKVIIQVDDNKSMEIMILPNSIAYKGIGESLDQIVSNIAQSTDIKSAKNSAEVIRRLLKELNAVCRNMQDESNQLYLKEVKIQLKDFTILGSEKSVCIKDFPGAGARYLGEEHKQIVRKEIESITNAVTVNVINADNSTFENVYDFMRNIKNIDDSKEGDIGSQIDFARSIYILNKAEVIKNWEEKKASVKKDLPNKKVVFCCADAGVQITARGQRAILRKNPYGSDEESNILDLQEYALLPDEYKESDVEVLTNEITNSIDNGSYLRNTGLVLCAGLIREYADNYAAVNRTRCYYQAVNKMINRLRDIETEKVADKETQKQKKHEEQTNVRDSLKRQCKSIVDECQGSVKESTINKELKDSTAGFLTEACDCANGLKNIKKEYRQQNKSIKKANKEKLKINKNAKPESKLDWRTEVSSDINTTIENQYESIKVMVDALMEQYCENAKDQMLENIKVTELTDEETKEIKKIISDFKPEKISGENYEMPESFEFSFSMGELGKFVFNHSGWQEERILDSVRDYWTDKIIEPYAKRLVPDIKKTLTALYDYICGRLDSFAPQLISLQNQIDEKERVLESFREKMKLSSIQCDLCEQIVESGVLNEKNN